MRTRPVLQEAEAKTYEAETEAIKFGLNIPVCRCIFLHVHVTY